MAKKSKKTEPEPEPVPANGKKGGKNNKSGKTVQPEQPDKRAISREQAQKGRAVVAQTTSWTGKLPGALLHEHCQKQKWNKVEYDMKKLPDGFIAVPHLSWVHPKTKELIQIKFHPPKELVKPQETPLEARHYAATYALHRIAFNKNIHMVLPTNHKNLWSDLEAERKVVTKENPNKAKLEYANDPFVALLEKRKEDEAKKKEREAKAAAMEKVKKPTIVIGSSTPLLKKPIARASAPEKKPVETQKAQTSTTSSQPSISKSKSAPPLTGALAPATPAPTPEKILNKVTFPKKVWDNSILFDLDSDLRISIEDAIKNHIEWSEEDEANHEHINTDTSYTHLLTKLGFRGSHAEESLKYTYTFNDSLEWLLFHLPEDDLPPCFTKDDSESNVKLRVAKDLKQERLIARFMNGGHSRDDVVSALRRNDFDLVESAILLTKSLYKGNREFDISHAPNSLSEWLEEKESLKAIFETKIKESDPPKDDIFEASLDVPTLKPGLMSLVVYRSKCYPQDICGLFLRVNDSSYSLPNYIKLSIISHLIDYLDDIGAFGLPYIYSCIDWLEQNIMEIINNPGPLSVPKSESLKKKSKDLVGAGDKSSDNINRAKKTSNKRQINSAKVEKHYEERITSPEYKNSVNNRAKLPAWRKQNDIVKVINENSVCLITGETGSGKSTQIVQFILDDLNAKKDFSTTIICTQPRRISTIGLADRISDERNDKCGLETGYIIRGENKTSDQTRISFVTTGVMLRMIQSVFKKSVESQDSFFSNLGYIFIDEVHERSIDSDFLMIILKKMLKNFPKLKIVLMSATIDKSIFDGFFDTKTSSSIAHAHIEGRTFPIDDYYLEDVLEMTDFRISNYRNNNYYDDEAGDDLIKPTADSKFFQLGNINYDLIKKLVMKIDETLNAENDRGSILIFLPGVMEIKKCLNAIDDDTIWKLPLHSALSSQEQKRIFQNPPPGKRKVIASTNIAETSITIPDAVVVIDTGRVKSVQYDAKSNNTKLVEIWASKAETKQRRGRAGRIRNGICYKLFTKDTEKKMIPQPIPEIKRTKLESVYLVVKSIGVKDVYEFLQNGLDPPHKDNVNNAKRTLIDVGALHYEEDTLTFLGKYLSMLPTDLRSGKMMIFGCIFGCLESSLTLAAVGVAGSPFTCKQEERGEMKLIQQKFGKDNGDMIAILNAYREYKDLSTMRERRKFCTDNFISMLRMNDIDSTRTQYLNNIKEIGFIPFSYGSKKAQGDDGYEKLNRNEGNVNIMKSILTASFYPQIAMVELPGTKYAQISGGAIALDPEFKKIKYWTRNERYRKMLENGEPILNEKSDDRIYPSTRIFLHPSSSLFVNEEKSSSNPSFIVFNNSQETSKLYVHGVTPSTTTSVLLFGGSIAYDLSNVFNSVRSRGIVMDNWLPIRTWCKNAVLIGKLRLLLDKIIQARLEDPNSDAGSDVLDVIEKLVKATT